MPEIGLDSSPEFQTVMTALCERYHDVFSAFSALDDQPEGKEQFRIDVPSNTTPEYCTLGRTSLVQREKMDEIVTNLLKLGIIRPSTSAWAARPLEVRKGADYRMCINYAPLNSHTKRINWPSPDIGDVTDALAGCSIFYL